MGEKTQEILKQTVDLLDGEDKETLNAQEIPAKIERKKEILKKWEAGNANEKQAFHDAVSQTAEEYDIPPEQIYYWINGEDIKMDSLNENFDFDQLKDNSEDAHNKTSEIQSILKSLGYALGETDIDGMYGKPKGAPQKGIGDFSESFTRKGVRKLQQMLLAQGYFLDDDGHQIEDTEENQNLIIDGLFGAQTLKATQKFLEENKLTDNGEENPLPEPPQANEQGEERIEEEARKEKLQKLRLKLKDETISEKDRFPIAEEAFKLLNEDEKEDVVAEDIANVAVRSIVERHQKKEQNLPPLDQALPYITFLENIDGRIDINTADTMARYYVLKYNETKDNSWRGKAINFFGQIIKAAKHMNQDSNVSAQDKSRNQKFIDESNEELKKLEAAEGIQDQPQPKPNEQENSSSDQSITESALQEAISNKNQTIIDQAKKNIGKQLSINESDIKFDTDLRYGGQLVILKNKIRLLYSHIVDKPEDAKAKAARMETIAKNSNVTLITYGTYQGKTWGIINVDKVTAPIETDENLQTVTDETVKFEFGSAQYKVALLLPVKGKTVDEVISFLSDINKSGGQIKIGNLSYQTDSFKYDTDQYVLKSLENKDNLFYPSSLLYDQKAKTFSLVGFGDKARLEKNILDSDNTLTLIVTDQPNPEKKYKIKFIDTKNNSTGSAYKVEEIT